jgi:hypothetical protein
VNTQLETFARNFLKEGLSQCTCDEQMVFKRIYANSNLELPIDKVVDNMPESKLDWAMQQVENTLRKKQHSI